ncbi:MAG: hypothetical protein ABMA13_12310 [Chthoniobacteraceae bacterium]
MSTPRNRRRLWSLALQQPSVWKRAATLGLSVGVLQAVLNQGDYWVSHTVNATILVKTIISPLVTFSVALVSAASTWAEKNNIAS